MNKTAIKNFAIWARNKLIADITYKAGLLGITDNKIKEPLPSSTKDVLFFDIGTMEPYAVTGIEIGQRKKLAEIIEQKAKQSDYATAYKSVVEEVAYTWFNRMIAVRFMEVNDYLPSHIRVLSSESETKIEPDLVTTPFDAGLDFTPYEKDRIVQLKNDNQLDELFRMLFIKQCNALNEILPELFETTSDYTELLLNINFTDKDGVVYRLVHDISEDDFKDAVQIIGWMYQYYNEERKNQVIDILSKGAIKKEDIPAATQLFTTDWVVRYMVDNSLGRYWLERNPESKLKEKLEFFVTPKEENFPAIQERINPQDLTFLDPCMGSGHILVYAFDVLIEIYRECGYSDRDAAVEILKNNIYGLDIDDRAFQLAYFAVMMKARSYNRRVLMLGIKPNICAIQESNLIDKFTCDDITTNKKQNLIGEYLVEKFRHAKEIGSLQTVDKKDYNAFAIYLGDCKKEGQLDIQSSYWMSITHPLMLKLLKQADIMSKKYSVVCTNPPYMNKFEGHLKSFVVSEYKPYSGDLFSVFMYRNFAFCKKGSYSAFMTPFVWMFIRTYENLRKHIIKNKSITTLAQMEYSAFEEATVPICSFVLKNEKCNERGIYFKLSDFVGGMDVQRQKILEALSANNCKYVYYTHEENFLKIPGIPIAYWATMEIFNAFSSLPLFSEQVTTRLGMATADNNNFVRSWFEVNHNKIGFSIESRDSALKSKMKWFPYNKGGDYRRWYGNNELVVNWENDGYEIRNFKDIKTGKIRSHNYNLDFIFKECLTWSALSSAYFSVRKVNKGFLFDDKGSSAFMSSDILNYVLGFLNSTIANRLINLLNPTISFQPGNLSRLPLCVNANRKTSIDSLVESLVLISKTDWDNFETSWNFEKHPLIAYKSISVLEGEQFSGRIKHAYNNWNRFVEHQFNTLKSNEEELNRIFIEIYGLQDEFEPEVEDKDVTVARIYDTKKDIPESMKGNNYVLTKGDVVKSFISYAVGCIFGRYSLDVDGLAYAGGKWDDNKYSTYIPDKDNVLPITDEEYFDDDIVGLFVAFVKKVYGAETLEENLDFIADALGNKGDTPREVIRNYFLKDFFKDHCKTYQKRPIYWLFDSGKADGFKALIYMHRYDENTIGNMRIDYLHRMQRVYESEIARMQETINNSTNAREVTAAEKRKEKLIKQLKETKDYDEKIAHLALARTPIDLDDGVKVNYEKVQTGTDGKKLDVLAGI